MNQGQPQYGGSFQPPPQQQQKGCIGRNWKWMLPVGCLGLILGGAALFAGIFFIAMSAIKSSEVYREALLRAQSHPAAVAQLGEPITDGWFVTGSVKFNNGRGNANLDIPVSGPKKSGTLHVLASTQGGDWVYEKLELAVEGGGRISLLDTGAEGAGPGSSADVEGDSDGAAAEEATTETTPASLGDDGPISVGVLNAKAVSKPHPPYPPVAKAARASGLVTVRVTVDETGRVVSAEAVSGHPLLQQAAVQAAREARLSPTLLGGKPVKVSGVLTYNFVLE